MKTLLRGDQPTYIDVEGMRVATNNKSRVTKWRTPRQVEKNIENLGTVGKNQNLKSIVMDGVNIRKIGKVGKVGKSETSETDAERKDQDEEKVCESIVKGLAKRNRVKYTILAEVGKSNACCALMTTPAKNCRGMKVRQAREQELKYLRDFE